MTAAKIAITIPQEQLMRVRKAVRAGRAESVSGYITRALVDEERRESLDAVVRDLMVMHGKPTKKETAWARRALGRPRRGG